jgi:hypothetical protein
MLICENVVNQMDLWVGYVWMNEMKQMKQIEGKNIKILTF